MEKDSAGRKDPPFLVCAPKAGSGRDRGYTSGLINPEFNDKRR